VVKRQGLEADHSPPSSAEVKLYLHSPNTPSWRGYNFTFTLLLPLYSAGGHWIKTWKLRTRNMCFGRVQSRSCLSRQEVRVRILLGRIVSIEFETDCWIIWWMKLTNRRDLSVRRITHVLITSRMYLTRKIPSSRVINNDIWCHHCERKSSKSSLKSKHSESHVWKKFKTQISSRKEMAIGIDNLWLLLLQFLYLRAFAQETQIPVGHWSAAGYTRLILPEDYCMNVVTTPWRRIGVVEV
jgi:hypothetical protein